MTINSTQLMSAYEQVRALVVSEPEIAPAFSPIEKVFEDKKSQPDACIMVYGVYNAGKSTLINALMGREDAPTGDIPLTSRINNYSWGKYSILDTPGVDAPKAHEEVTKEQMLKADVVIFVVNPLGTAEEEKTLSALVDILAEHKQVFMVFNEKHDLTEEDFIRLKDQTRAQLQKMAIRRGLSNILKDVPIVRLNARDALDGQLDNDPELLEISGYPAFKSQLVEFLDGISPHDVYERIKNQLLNFLSRHIDILNSQRSGDAVVNHLNNFSRQMIREKSALTSDMAREIEKERQSIYERTKRALRSSPENYQSQIESILHQSSSEMERYLNHRLQEIMVIAQQDIAELQASMPKVGAYSHDGKPLNIRAKEKSVPAPQASGNSGIPVEMVIDTSKQIAAMVRPEHVVSTLKTVKEVLPSLMKGIGPKTMEKWAGTVIGKYVPYIGTVVTAALALRAMFSDDPEEKAMREQLEQQRLSRERAEQQMDDFAQELSDGFKQFMHANLLPEIDNIFAQLTVQVSTMREGFNQQEQWASERLQKWENVRQLTLSA